MRLQVAQRRHHGHENADEQKRHLPDRPKAELVRRVHAFRGGEIRPGRRREHHDLAQKKPLGQEHRPDDREEEEDVDAALDPKRVRRRDPGLDALRRPPEGASIVGVEDRQQGADHGEPDPDHMLDQPEKRHAAQVAQKQGRIPDRGERAAAIRNDKDKKHHMVGADADLVHPDVGPDQHHRGAGGADEVGQDRADQQQHDVVPRRRLALDPEVDAPRHHEQGTHQSDERKVFVRRMPQRRRPVRHAHEIKSTDQRRQRQRRVRMIPFPEVLQSRRRQRHDRDEQQQQPEGQDQGGVDIAGGPSVREKWK
jgi:hypothetical protein